MSRRLYVTGDDKTFYFRINESFTNYVFILGQRQKLISFVFTTYGYTDASQNSENPFVQFIVAPSTNFSSLPGGGANLKLKALDTEDPNLVITARGRTLSGSVVTSSDSHLEHYYVLTVGGILERTYPDGRLPCQDATDGITLVLQIPANPSAANTYIANLAITVKDST